MEERTYGKDTLSTAMENLRYFKGGISVTGHRTCKVYYWKDIKWLTKLSFIELGMDNGAIPTQSELGTQYIKVADFETWTNDPEQIWIAMNLEPGEYFDESAYAQMRHAHTSMSIGDIVQLGDKWYIAISVGFKELQWK